MHRHVAIAPIIGLIAALLAVLAPMPARAVADKDCADFDTQAQAQNFYRNNDPNNDPHRLDGSDNDGIVCESLPCPCSTQSQPDKATAGPTTLRQRARVIKVIDGDTVDVRMTGGAKRRVRLVGIDTPEVYGRVECGGRKASASLMRLLPAGTGVRLISDPTQARTDRYGRLLRYVTKSSTGADMNRKQVWSGWARVYVYDHVPFKRVGSYRDAQRSANAHDRGIWKLCR